MLPGSSIKCFSYKRKDAINNVLENRLFTVNAMNAGIENAFRSYLADGYTVFDAPASGNIDLTGETPGKYIVVWKTNSPTGTLNVSVANTCTGSGDVRHTDVVIMGIKVSSLFEIEQINLNLDINFTHTDNFDGDFKIIYAEVNVGNGAYYRIDDLKIDNCIFNCAVKFDYFNCLISNTTINLNLTANASDFGFWWNTGSLNRQLFNCRFVNNTSGSYSVKFSVYYSVTDQVDTPTLQNVVIQGFDNHPNSYFVIAGANSGGTGPNPNMKWNAISVFIKDSYFKFGNNSNGNRILYVNNAQPKVTDMKDFILKTIDLSMESQFYIGVPEIDFVDTVDFSEFLTLSADFAVEYVRDVTRYYNRERQLYYSVTFIKDQIIPDKLKKFGDDYLFFVQREDIEAELVPSTGSGKVIYNYTLYATGGHTTPYDYDNNENFLILANTVADGSGTNAIFIYQQNKIKPTVFSDVLSKTDYIIQHVFQIWEIETMTDLIPTVRVPSEPKPIKDSPLSGSIRFNNWDNEVTVR